MEIEILTGIAIAAGGALALWLGNKFCGWIRRRVVITSPDRRRTDRLEARMDKIEPLLNQIADNQLPLLNGMAALIEAVKTGVANGKLSSAGGAVSDRTEAFAEFLVDAVKPDQVVREEESWH